MPNYREGTQPQPSTENWIKDLLSMTLPTRAQQDPVLPTANPSHQEASQASYPHPSEARRMKATITEN